MKVEVSQNKEIWLVLLEMVLLACLTSHRNARQRPARKPVLDDLHKHAPHLLVDFPHPPVLFSWKIPANLSESQAHMLFLFL